jgi:hypothetical protein
MLRRLLHRQTSNPRGNLRWIVDSFERLPLCDRPMRPQRFPIRGEPMAFRAVRIAQQGSSGAQFAEFRWVDTSGESCYTFGLRSDFPESSIDKFDFMNRLASAIPPFRVG